MIERDIYQKFAEINKRDFPHYPLEGYGRLLEIWQTDTIFTGDYLEFKNKKSGIVISNHPSSLDLAMLSKLFDFESQDLHHYIKIMVNEKSYGFYAKYFGRDNFISTSSKPRETVSIFNNLLTWINDGGLVLMFPFKRNNNIERTDLQLETGFLYLLNKIDSGKSLLSVSINSTDASNAGNDLSLFKLNLNLVGWSLIRSTAKAKKDIKVFVNSSLANVWQSHIDSTLNNQENNQSLLNKYKQIHIANL